jgi:hypothetical protein
LAALGLISASTVRAQLQTAGEVFVDVNAAGQPDGLLTSITNNGTLGGYFEARGGGDTVPVIALVGGVRCIQFDGTDYMQLVGALGGAVTPPPAGIVGVDPTCTVEVWAYNPAVDAEETMVSWGKRGGPDGSNLSFGYGVDGRWGAVGHWGNPDIGWKDYGGSPTAKNWHYLVYTFDGTTTRVYSDGSLANQEVDGAGVLNTAANTAINLATQLEADGITPTTALRGSLSLARVRVHDGALTPEQIASNYAFEKGDFGTPPAAQSLAGLPTHRWSFNEPANANAGGQTFKDSIGTADGIVQGTGARFSGSRLILPGGSSASASYGDLPNHLLSANSTNAGGSGAVTLEGWVKVTTGRTWSRIIDFGSSDIGGGVGGEVTGPGGGGAGLDYLFYTAQRGDEVGVHRLEVRNEDPAGGGTTTTDVPDLGVFNNDLHFAVTWDEASGQLKAFENGQQVGDMVVDDAMSDINDVNVWLGRSNWTGDQNMQGEFDEFRIYNRVLSPGEIVGNFGAGPDTLNTGEQAVRIVSSPANTTGFDTYSASLGVAVAGTPPVSVQWFRGLAATLIPGATSLTYTFPVTTADNGAIFFCVASNFAQGSPHTATSATATLTVVTQAVTLRHLYTFNETGGATAHDSAGTADGQVVGNGTFNGTGQLALDGANAYVNLPNDLVSTYSSVTFEAWIQDDGSAGWARIFDFGNSSAGEDFPIGAGGASGTTYMFLSQPSGFGNLRGAYTLTGGGAGEQLVTWPGHAITVGQPTHVVWTSQGPARTGRLYVNAVMVDANPNMTITPADVGPTSNDWLGRSQFNDPFFKGSFDEFRIYEGALTPNAVAARFTAGPTTGLGTIRLTAALTDLGDVKISWSAFLGNYTLQSSAVLGAGASWTEVPDPVVPEGDNNTVTLFVDSNNPNRFFRLVQ